MGGLRFLLGFIATVVAQRPAQLAGVISLWSCIAVASPVTHGFAIHSELGKSAEFEHFDYVNPDAPQGGTLRQGTTITFNSTNQMRFPGKSPNELTYIYDTLMARALDEPASFYGLLAGQVEVADDFTVARFELRPEARWHDGLPVTAEDVLFTFETLRTHGLPLYRSTLAEVSMSVETDRVIVFRSASPGDWRYLDLVSTFPVHPKHFWEDRDLGQMTLDVPLGSGPYHVAEFAVNDRVLLRRATDYWARDLPVNRGLWNFDQIETFYFRDHLAVVQALKAGFLDVNREFDAGFWQGTYDGPALKSGELIQSTFTDPAGGRLAALVFNLRRPPLDDVRVREALAFAYDGRWTRNTLFGGLYDPPGPLYGTTEMSASGPPSEAERAILKPFLESLPDSVQTSPDPPLTETLPRRERLRRADALLRSAGYHVIDGQRVDRRTGQPMQLEFVGTRASFRRVLGPYADGLMRLGIDLEIRIFDYVNGREAILSHDIDITSSGFLAEFPPGQHERIFWHSERANEPGYALAGAKDDALDAAVEAMVQSTDLASIAAATGAFERVLRSQHYLLPLWRVGDIWIAHHKNLAFPDEFIFPGFHFIPSLYWERSSE